MSLTPVVTIFIFSSEEKRQENHKNNYLGADMVFRRYPVDVQKPFLYVERTIFSKRMIGAPLTTGMVSLMQGHNELPLELFGPPARKSYHFSLYGRLNCLQCSGVDYDFRFAGAGWGKECSMCKGTGHNPWPDVRHFGFVEPSIVRTPLEQYLEDLR